MLIYSFAEKKWRPLLKGAETSWNWNGSLAWPSWSHDSKYVYVQDSSDIIRVDVATGTVKKILNIANIPMTGVSLPNWFDLTPDDKIMILRSMGTREIHALQLEY